MIVKMVRSRETGRAAPLLFCDVCGLKIDDLRLAAVVFHQTDLPVEIKVAHKGKCHDAAEAATPKPHGWLELSQQLAYLVNNIGGDAFLIQEQLDRPEFG